MKNVYDNQSFFNQYQSMRKDGINANNLIEIPLIKSMLPNLKDKTILDLGCGTGDMDKYFANMGAKYVLATDISSNMISQAKTNNFHDKIEYKILKMEDLCSVNQKFDIVYSSLAFHYIKDFDKLLKDINRLLKSKGMLIFSQESPINLATSKQSENEKNKIEIDGKLYFLLSGYCNEGERKVFWNDCLVTKYHRTYATIVNTLIKNNFEILEIQDSYATEEAISLCEKLKYQKDRPYFTFVKAKKAD